MGGRGEQKKQNKTVLVDGCLSAASGSSIGCSDGSSCAPSKDILRQLGIPDTAWAAQESKSGILKGIHLLRATHLKALNLELLEFEVAMKFQILYLFLMQLLTVREWVRAYSHLLSLIWGTGCLECTPWGQCSTIMCTQIWPQFQSGFGLHIQFYYSHSSLLTSWCWSV